jgi:hypothetical protein
MSDLTSLEPLASQVSTAYVLGEPIPDDSVFDGSLLDLGRNPGPLILVRLQPNHVKPLDRLPLG